MRERGQLPEVLLMENVDAILHKANIEEFKRWIRALDDLGYCSAYKVLNAKDYGVPQNRKRCFMVSTLHKGQFVFPKGRPLERRLKDVLETDVPESYYLSDERIASYERHRTRAEENGNGYGWQLTDPSRERESKTVLTNPQKGSTMAVIDPRSVRGTRT